MKNTLLRIVALTMALSFGFVSVGFTAGGSIGHGNISVYKDGALLSKLSGQNPIEDGSLLVCEGKCMIKSEGITLIAGDNAQVAVMNETDVFKLYVKEGTVDYIISNNVRKIAFHTPQGTYTVAEVVFNAGSQAVVKGSVVVDKDGKTEISVTEGRLIFATVDGMKTVDANNKIVLAFLPGSEAGFSWGLAALGAAVVVGTVLVIDNNSGSSSSAAVAAPAAPAAAAPATPPPAASTPSASPSN